MRRPSPFPIHIKALRVEQPLGTYYVTVLPARVLLDVAFSDALSATWSEERQTYLLEGTQRLRDPKRLKPVAGYIDRQDAAFPNTIILAANYRREDGLLEDGASPDEDGDPEEGDDYLWYVTEHEDGCHVLTIPSDRKIVSVIDGQHRLFAFAEAIAPRLDMQLICSVFLGLPKPYQAQLFATINSNQKPVDKSLTYELFGYNIDEEDEKYWSPDKLAVYFTRRLAVDADSPLQGRIQIAPVQDHVLTVRLGNQPWKVSTAVIVEGIMRLFSSNPKTDTANLLKDKRKPRAAIELMRADRSPLRTQYLLSKDAVIYSLVRNYFAACDILLWKHAGRTSFITRTIGIQALLDILKRLSRPALEARDISVDHFCKELSPAADIDFSAERFQNASGAGRTIIRRSLEEALGLPPLGRPKSSDR